MGNSYGSATIKKIRAVWQPTKFRCASAILYLQEIHRDYDIHALNGRNGPMAEAMGQHRPILTLASYLSNLRKHLNLLQAAKSFLYLLIAQIADAVKKPGRVAQTP